MSDEKRKEQIAQPRVKKSLKNKFKEAFTHDDVESIGDYIFFQVLMPAAKDMISDTVRNFVDIFLYGSSGGNSNNRRREYYRDNVSYRRESNIRRDYDYCTTVNPNDISEVVFKTRVEAINVLASLRADISDYGSATLGSFKELTGLDVEITDHNYGWRNLDSARPAASRGGYVLMMPKATYLK